jgi:hypothetical protein
MNANNPKLRNTNFRLVRKSSTSELLRSPLLKFHSNRKAQVQFFLESAFRIGFLMVALLAFFLLINFYIKHTVDTNKLQAEVTANRILYSDVITYNDPTILRTYNGIIDLNKFSDTALNSGVNYPVARHATAKLELISNLDDKKIREIYLNKPQYAILDGLTNVGGKGSATKYYKTYPVTYKDANTFYYGTLRMTIIIPNS